MTDEKLVQLVALLSAALVRIDELRFSEKQSADVRLTLALEIARESLQGSALRSYGFGPCSFVSRTSGRTREND